MSRSTISAYELNRRFPTPEPVCSISDFRHGAQFVGSAVSCCAITSSSSFRFVIPFLNCASSRASAHEGSEVWGVLYSIPDLDLRTLDEGEGGYHRVRMPVRTTDNANIDACVYVASRPSNDPTLRPYTWYKRFLVEGAREHSLPTLYISELERIEAVRDTDEERDRRKSALTCQAQP